MNDSPFITISSILNDVLGKYAVSDLVETKASAATGVFPGISRVIFNKDKTIVTFKDNTKIVVTCGANDTYDRQTAIVYAIVKRIFWKGKYDKKGNLDTAGFYSWIQKLVDTAYDQDKADSTEKERKAKARADHEERQKAEHEKAVARRVARRAAQLEIEEAAKAKLAASKCPKYQRLINESKDATDTLTETTDYIKPNKKFKDFTTSEKREYWRAQKRRQNKSK